MALERKVTVRVDLMAGGNLGAKMAENRQQAQQLQAAMAKQPAVQAATAHSETWAAVNRDLQQQRGRMAVLQSSSGRAAVQETAQLEEAWKAQKRLNETRGQFLAMRSPQGRAMLQEQTNLMRLMNREQERATLLAERGAIGGRLALFAQRGEPLFGAARTAAALGGGIMAAGIAANQVQSDQLAGSAKMLAGELGLVLTPQVAQTSAWLQRMAVGVREMSDGTKTATGNILFWGTATATVVGGLGLFARTTSDAIHGLRTLGQWAGFARGGAGGLQAGAGAVDATGNLAAAASTSQFVALMNRIVPALAVLYATIDRGNAAYQTFRNPNIAAAEAFGTASSYTSNVGMMGAGTALSASQRIMGWLAPEQMARMQAITSHPEASWLTRTLGGLMFGATAGGGGLMPPEALFDRQGQMGAYGAGYDQSLLSLYQGAPQERDREARSRDAMVNSLNQLNDTIQQRIPPQEP